jgi:hypothetical protein
VSVLASQVISRINSLFSDSTNSKWTEAEKLEAVNYAIDNAWPHIRAVAQDVTQTIASGTYTYSPSATPEVECGFAQAYAQRTGYPDAQLKQVSQSQSGTTFTVRLSDRDAAAYTGYTLRLVYTARIARVTATTDAIELPLDYLYKAAAVALMTNKMLDESKADVSAYEKMLVKYERDIQTALIQNQRGLIPHLIARTLDAHGGAGSERLTSGEHA